MKQILSAAAVLFCLLTHGQKVIFQSTQSYSQEQLADLYASLTVQGNLLLFNAPDYNLYAYDKSTGALKWTTPLGWKSNTPPYFVQDHILANNGKEQVVRLDTATGKLVKTLPFWNISSQPLVRGGLLYTTAIYEAGNLLAYDPVQDSVIWFRFLAHGMDQQPYYEATRIWANGEGDTWFEFNYQGRILSPACDSTEAGAPWTPSCSQAFLALTHDGKKITGPWAKKLGLSEYDRPQVFYTPRATLLLGEGTLHTIGNRLKRKASRPLHTLLPGDVEEDALSTPQLLKAEGDLVWLLYNHRLLAYDFRKKRLRHSVDLSAWQPHNALLDEDRLWFVSQKDGRLYGVGGIRFR
ncbi:MAG TPA: PQQ-binding-like beta-propeller repeat protein [Chitinophagaceae bacterium]